MQKLIRKKLQEDRQNPKKRTISLVSWSKTNIGFSLLNPTWGRSRRWEHGRLTSVMFRLV